jgi:hypothetical protein
MRLSDILGKTPHRHRIVVQCASLAECSPAAPAAPRSTTDSPRIAFCGRPMPRRLVLQGSATEPYCWTAPLVERDFFMMRRRALP